MIKKTLKLISAVMVSDDLVTARFLIPPNVKTYRLLPLGIPITQEMASSQSAEITPYGDRIVTVNMNYYDYPHFIGPYIYCEAIFTSYY